MGTASCEGCLGGTQSEVGGGLNPTWHAGVPGRAKGGLRSLGRPALLRTYKGLFRKFHFFFPLLCGACRVPTAQRGSQKEIEELGQLW